jgi:hypothetical protein
MCPGAEHRPCPRQWDKLELTGWAGTGVPGAASDLEPYGEARALAHGQHTTVRKVGSPPILPGRLLSFVGPW